MNHNDPDLNFAYTCRNPGCNRHPDTGRFCGIICKNEYIQLKKQANEALPQ